MAKLVPARCNPNPVSTAVLSDDDGDDGILVDANETALLTDTTRTGAGFAFEYERQEPSES